MLNKDEVCNGFKVLSEKIDERYLDLTIKQFEDLKNKLGEAWGIIERRAGDRRDPYSRR